MLTLRAFARRTGGWLAGALLFTACSKTPEATPESAAPPVEAANEAAPADTTGIELPPGDGPVAIVSGAPVSREDFNRAYIQTVERFQRSKHEVKPALRERLKDNIVRRLVDQLLIEQRAKTMGVSVDPTELETKWAEHKKRYGSEEAFRAFLERAGTTAEDVRDNFEANHLREAVFAQVGRDVTVSGEEIREFYEANRERYAEPEMIRASHILIRVPPGADAKVMAEKKALAEKIRKEASAKKADFAALAAQYGEDPTKDRGGDLGFFPRGRMVKPFEDAAWGLKKGKISKVVKTQFGFHVIKKVEHRKATEKKLDAMSEQIERGLLARKRNTAIRDALETWKEEAKVEILVKGDPAIINAEYDRPPGGGPTPFPAKPGEQPVIKMPNPPPPTAPTE